MLVQKSMMVKSKKKTYFYQDKENALNHVDKCIHTCHLSCKSIPEELSFSLPLFLSQQNLERKRAQELGGFFFTFY
ncbi:hypothetical protein L2E82_16485 [Cichorium intybus]|uniref:Uncharacterized protein n=1 Tax=Cichorium intybus TaxID=13427 RepID=A0ACB9F5N9_CICIN|nr:hypothetical protein L2E82_16485 [Cichorium intybus]